MELFVPITAKGQRISLPFQFWPFKFNFVWPLAYDCPKYQLVIANCLVMISLVTYLGGIHGEWTFIFAHTGEIEKISECLCTTLVGTQAFIRIVHLMLRRNQLRDVLEKFYTKIYIHESENKEIHKICERRLRLLYLNTSTYILPLVFMFLATAVLVARYPDSRSKPYFYRMEFPYDAQSPWPYFFTSLYTGWVGVSSATILVAQDTLIGTTLTYCTVHYEMLHTELQELYESSLNCVARRPPLPNELHGFFNSKLKAIIEKQQLIDKFARDLQDMVSVSLFAMVSFGTVILCTVAFELAKTELGMGAFQYIFWLSSQGLEFLVIGSYGQRYTDAAAQMANSYYMCNWESLLPHGDAEANSKLIKDISFAIYRSQKSVHLNGLQFVILSLNSIGSALSSSVSYFMFLNTMEDITIKINGNK